MAIVPVGEVPEAILRVARPLRRESEIAQLLELVGPARIVLLGEASHGTHEFYELRAAVTRSLIAEHGFQAVVIEGDWPDALRVDRYVRLLGDDGSAAEALVGFDRFPPWMWRNSAVAAFVEWLRQHNGHQASEARAGFYGMDLYSLRTSIAAVLSYLAEEDPGAAARARARYACFDHAGGAAHASGIAANCEFEVVAQLVEMQRRHVARSGRSPRGDSWFHALQNASVVRQAEAYYRAMFDAPGVAWNLRATHMADTIDALAAHLATADGPARLVVWAHNSHVGDARATSLPAHGGLTVGQLMRQRHPGEVTLVGFTTDHGTVECAPAWDQPGVRERVRPGLPGSWEELFHETGLPRFAIAAPALQQAVGARAERLHRAIGVVYRPETERQSHYYHARLAAQYDVVVHIDASYAVHPLAGAAAPPASGDDPPETYPSGV